MKKKMLLIGIAVIAIISIIIVILNLKKADDTVVDINQYNYFRYKNGEMFGVIDREGNTIIDAAYKYVIIPNPEKDLFVCYENEEERKFLNSKNEEILTKYSNIEPIKLKNIVDILCYEKSVLKYEKDGLYGLIDFEGKEITKNIYSSIENLQGTEGKFLISKDDKYGVINLKGKELIKPQYDNIGTDSYYDENTKYAKAGFIVSNRTDDGYRYGYIDYSGNQILETSYNEIIRLAGLDEPYIIVSENGKYGLYKSKKQIIKPEYQLIEYTESKALILGKNQNYGIANLNGEIKVDFKYSEIEAKGIYLYAKSQNENIVYDVNGKTIDMNFNKTIYNTENDDYKISTTLNNKVTYYGVESKDGKTLVEDKYMYLEYLYGDYFIAKNKKGDLGVINSNGKTILDFKDDSIQKLKDKNVLQILDVKSKTNTLYSSDMQKILTMKNSNINLEKEYIKIYNDKETKYLDNNGKEISEDSEAVVNSNKVTLPEKIGDYKGVAYSLEEIYYEK